MPLRTHAPAIGPRPRRFVHVSLVPVLGSVGEQKTKPTQHSVKELRSVGIAPDLIICRSVAALAQSTRDKLAQFCQVDADCVLTVNDVTNIYHVPLLLEAQGATAIMTRMLGLAASLPRSPPSASGISSWRAIADAYDATTMEVSGPRTCSDAYR